MKWSTFFVSFIRVLTILGWLKWFENFKVDYLLTSNVRFWTVSLNLLYTSVAKVLLVVRHLNSNSPISTAISRLFSSVVNCKQLSLFYAAYTNTSHTKLGTLIHILLFILVRFQAYLSTHLKLMIIFISALNYNLSLLKKKTWSLTTYISWIAIANSVKFIAWCSLRYWPL